MILEKCKFIMRSGAFSEVFCDPISKEAYKLFISFNHPNLDGTCKEENGKFKENAYRNSVFESEFKAYQRIQNSQILLDHTPIFGGKVNIETVLDKGVDISENFLLDCCYKMEYIQGKSGKLFSLIRNKKDLQALQRKIGFEICDIRKAFRENGVMYLTDSQYIFNDLQFKIVDFGTEDILNIIN